MKSPFYFIVSPNMGKRYDNIKKVGDLELITSSSKEDHVASNREAVVVATPKWYKGEIEPGDKLLVHHNVFKYYYDMKGRQSSGWSFFRDKTFLLSADQFYMYNHGGEWKTIRDCCFVSPIDSEDGLIARTITKEPLVGVLKYGNAELTEMGINVGDVVGFEPESEYAFNVEGEKMYRMFTKNISIKFDNHEFLENITCAV